MRFLNPKTDFAFKKIFGSSESKEFLLSFLNAIFGLESPCRLLDLTIIDPYNAPKIKGMKGTYLDVKAHDEQGKDYIIECHGRFHQCGDRLSHYPSHDRLITVS